MKIFVKKEDGKRVELNVEASNTIGEVKNMLVGREGIPAASEQRILFAGKELEDGQTLMHCGVSKDDVLDVIYRVRPNIQLNVVVGLANSIVLNVNLANTVASVKEKIRSKSGFEPKVLIFAGKPLNDNTRLFETDIVDGSTVTASQRSKGGG